jgi:hypothetical protein
MDIKVIYRIFHPTATEYTFISVVHETVPKIDDLLGLKQDLKIQEY